jgi:hypothetical protein
MSTPQRLCKTAKAWSLLAQPAGISRSVHALLLLANGQRSEQELSLLLGNDVSGLVRGLLVQGYLQPATPQQVDDDEDAATAPAWPVCAGAARTPAGVTASA